MVEKSVYKKKNDNLDGKRIKAELIDVGILKFNPINLDYDTCMELYIDEDESLLEEYIERGKETGTISRTEVSFWNDAIETDTVKDILRTAIMELRSEDRKNDPINVRMARKTVKVLEDFENEEKNDYKENLNAFKKVYSIGVLLKEIVKEKSQNPQRKTKDIFKDANKIVNQKEEEIFKKAKENFDKIRDFFDTKTRDSNGVDIGAYKMYLYKAKVSKLVASYDEIKINDYIEEYQNSKKIEKEADIKDDKSKNNAELDTNNIQSISDEDKTIKVSGKNLGIQTKVQQGNMIMKTKVLNLIQRSKEKIKDNQIKFGE